MHFGGFYSAEKTPPSLCFHPHWIFPRLAESWFWNPSAPVQHHFPEILFCRNMRMDRVIRWFTEARGKSYGHVCFVIHLLQNLMTQWWMDVEEQRIFSHDKIFTVSKASGRNLWSFVALAKILLGQKIVALEMALRWQSFLQTKQNFA